MGATRPHHALEATGYFVEFEYISQTGRKLSECVGEMLEHHSHALEMGSVVVFDLVADLHMYQAFEIPQLDTRVVL